MEEVNKAISEVLKEEPVTTKEFDVIKTPEGTKLSWFQQQISAVSANN